MREREKEREREREREGDYLSSSYIAQYVRQNKMSHELITVSVSREDHSTKRAEVEVNERTMATVHLPFAPKL